MMLRMKKKIELLSPAKNAEQGKAAIGHGADALYIGAPNFGARTAAGNSIEDIEELVRYSHLFGSKVFVTVNTLLYDDELEAAEKMIWQLYNSGVDALIVQDMGLLELDLPPIELHASTQTHNIDLQRIKFLEQVGFKRIILARETSLSAMSEISKNTTADLEAFVHGALCVSYSGQCYMSRYLDTLSREGEADIKAIRSGNRGSCTQPCRSSYNLTNSDGQTLIRNRHLLSLRDFSASQHIESMIDAGISSFKIEGRLKDIAYVKNVTAYYRQIIDNVLEGKKEFRKASSGTTVYFFEPDIERTFNRGFTDYFLIQRQKMASFATQKSLAKMIGTALPTRSNKVTIKSKESIIPGDGLCYFNNDGTLEGFLVNHVQGNVVTANKSLNISKESKIWRNNDIAFERKMNGDSAERKITVTMKVKYSDGALVATVTDEDGIIGEAKTTFTFEEAKEATKAVENIKRQLYKLGDTPFTAKEVETELSYVPFIPSSVLNQLRRDAIEELKNNRLKHFKPEVSSIEKNDVPYFETTAKRTDNIINTKAEEFYNRHGVSKIERGVDSISSAAEMARENTVLMRTKYCLRYELGQCLKRKCNKQIDKEYQEELFLENNGTRFKLTFDCQKCEMAIRATRG